MLSLQLSLPLPQPLPSTLPLSDLSQLCAFVAVALTCTSFNSDVAIVDVTVVEPSIEVTIIRLRVYVYVTGYNCRETKLTKMHRIHCSFFHKFDSNFNVFLNSFSAQLFSVLCWHFVYHFINLSLSITMHYPLNSATQKKRIFRKVFTTTTPVFSNSHFLEIFLWNRCDNPGDMFQMQTTC